MHDGLVSSGMLLKDGNRCMVLILIQIWFGHGFELNIGLVGCALLHIIHEWLHWFTLDLFLWAIRISLENSIGWYLGVSIWIDRFSHSHMSHLSSQGGHITANLIVVNIAWPLSGISYLNNLVLGGWVTISKCTHLVWYVISKLGPLLRTVEIINHCTRNHVALVLLIVLRNLIMHSLLMRRHHYNFVFVNIL